MKRRQILKGSAAGFLLGAPMIELLAGRAANAQGKTVGPDERILGKADAPVTIIEYASLTCPHCATFHAQTLPEIKKGWIDTGRARLVYRDFPLDGLALRAAALADCIEGDPYFAFLDALFRSQQRWARAQDPMGALAQIALLAGIDQQTFDACVSDNAKLDTILRERQEGESAFGVNSTPTVIVNGRKIEGALGVKQLGKILDEAAS